MDNSKYIDFDLYQRLASKTAIYEDRMYPVASLMVEAAELADLFIKPMLRGSSRSTTRVRTSRKASTRARRLVQESPVPTR